MAEKVSHADDSDFTMSLNDKLRKIPNADHNTEFQALKNRLLELETSNKILGSKLSEILDIVSTGPDNRIIELEMKLRQLETEKNELEYYLNITKKEQVDNVDKLIDSIRKISTQNAEIEVQVRTLKTKVPQLEDLTRRQESNIETIKQKYNDTTFEKIKDLEKNVGNMEESNKKLEDQVEKMSAKQNKMTDEAEQKMKQTFEQKLELESKINKLKGKIKEMEHINNDLLGRLEEMKSKAMEIEESDKEKAIKMSTDIETLNQNLRLVNDEKNRFEKDNTGLKKEIKIMKVKLVAYEKEL